MVAAFPTRFVMLVRVELAQGPGSVCSASHLGLLEFLSYLVRWMSRLCPCNFPILPTIPGIKSYPFLYVLQNEVSSAAFPSSAHP